MDNPKTGFSQLRRFLTAGVANTILTYALYLLGMQVVDYRIAYALAVAAGLLFNTIAHTFYVFDARSGLRSTARFAGLSVAYFLANLLLITVMVEWLSVPAVFAPAIALAITIPANFLLGRWIART